MITLIYRAIVLFVLIFTVWNLFEEKELKSQAMIAMVVIPLILRVLMVK